MVVPAFVRTPGSRVPPLLMLTGPWMVTVALKTKLAPTMLPIPVTPPVITAFGPDIDKSKPFVLMGAEKLMPRVLSKELIKLLAVRVMEPVSVKVFPLRPARSMAIEFVLLAIVSGSATFVSLVKGKDKVAPALTTVPLAAE